MAEKPTAFVEVNVVYECDTGDGGILMYSETVFDEQGVPSYNHTCTNPDDREVYRFDVKYPYTKMVPVLLNLILAP